MPPIYELANNILLGQKDGVKMGKNVPDMNLNNKEAGLYFALVLAFYVLVIAIILGTNYSKRGCRSYQSPAGRKMVVDFYEGDKVASSLVSEDEEDDRDNVVPL